MLSLLYRSCTSNFCTTTTTKIFSSAGSIFAGIKGRIPEAVHYQERALRQDPSGAVINTANYDKSQAGYEILTTD